MNTSRKKKYICLHCFEEVDVCDESSYCSAPKFFCGGIGENGDHTNVVSKEFYEKNRDEFINQR